MRYKGYILCSMDYLCNVFTKMNNSFGKLQTDYYFDHNGLVLLLLVLLIICNYICTLLCVLSCCEVISLCQTRWDKKLRGIVFHLYYAISKYCLQTAIQQWIVKRTTINDSHLCMDWHSVRSGVIVP